MYGGDEVNAVVVEVGSHTTKAGYAGEETPKTVFPSVVGVLPESNPPSSSAGPDIVGANEEDGTLHLKNRRRRRLHHIVGASELQYCRDHMEVKPVLSEGRYTDWELVEDCWDHAFRERLRLDMTEHPVMLAGPTTMSRSEREGIVEAMFESQPTPAVFLARNAVLSSFAVGRPTSVVVDLGHEAAIVAAVYEGFVLQKSVQTGPLAGKLLTQCILSSLQKKPMFKLRPHHVVKKIEIAPGNIQVAPLERPLVTESYNQWAVFNVASDIKESVCRVSDTTFIIEDNANIPTQSYELPDGNEVHMGPDRFGVPEVLFQPSLLQNYPGVRDDQGADIRSMHDMVVDCIGHCDVDVRRDLYAGIVCTGGTALLPGLRERMEKELQDSCPPAVKSKVISQANALERRFSAWIGGSILASLGSFQQMWMSRSEYQEHGSALIHKKSA